MKMRFKIKTSDLNEAFGALSIVIPKPVTKDKQSSGFLFVIEGNKCHIQSRDSQHVTRFTLDVIETDTNGTFIYPAAGVDVFKYMDGDITFDVSDENDVHLIRYDGGQIQDVATISPKFHEYCAQALTEATSGYEFNVSLLRDAITAARPFLPPPKDEERTRAHFKVLQMFEPSRPEWEKGNGYLFATNSSKAFFFDCEAFKGKGLAIFGGHVSTLVAFLSKLDGSDTVTIRQGKNMTFAVAKGGDYIFGWAHYEALHERFSYYGLTEDQIVLMLPVDTFRKQLLWTRAALHAGKNRVKVIFDAEKSQIQFQLPEGDNKGSSIPVIAEVVQNKVNEGFTFNIHLDNFLDMFNGLHGLKVYLRVHIEPPSERRPKKSAAFRTIDEYFVDTAGKVLEGGVPADPNAKSPENTYRCRVTRYMSSMT